MTADLLDTLLAALDGGVPPDRWSLDSRSHRDVQAAWEATGDPGQLLRVCLHAGDRRGLVRAACACARLALRNVPAHLSHLREPVEVAEAWSRGDVSLDAVKQAAAVANSLTAREDLDEVARAAIGAAGAASEDAFVTNAALATARVLAGATASDWSTNHARALVELAALVRATVANPLPMLLEVARRTTVALFDELLQASAVPARPSEEPVRARMVRTQLLRREDLPQVLSAALGATPPAQQQQDVLGAHRYQLALRLAVSLLDELDASVAAPVLIAASHSPHGDVADTIAPALYRLVQRSPRWWATVLDPTKTGLKVLRWCVARLEGPKAPPLGPELAREVMQLARSGVAIDLAYPVVAQRLGDEGRRLLVQLSCEASLSADRRVGALIALRTVMNEPERFELGRSLVEANTHTASWELVLAVLEGLEAGGLDAAFAFGSSDRVFRTAQELGQAMIAWLANAAQPRHGVGLWPMYRGTYAGPEGRVLAPCRDPHFLVDGLPVWQVERQWWLDEDDPQQVTLRHQLLDAKAAPLTRAQLATGTYLEGRARLAMQCQPADAPRPFGDAPGEPPQGLGVRWWRAVGARTKDGVSAELAVLPLRRSPGSRAPRPGVPLVYCWFMPEGEQLRLRAQGQRTPPGHLRLYGFVLSGELSFDEAAERGAPLQVELVFPLPFAGDRDLYVAAIASLSK